MPDGKSRSQQDHVPPVPKHEGRGQRYQKSQVIVGLQIKNVVKAQLQVSRKYGVVQA